LVVPVGIGKATAKQLLVNGATVHVISRDQNSIDSATNELKVYGNVFGLKSDITCADQVQKLTLKIDKEFGKIDFLVNASGIFSPKPFLISTADDYDCYMDHVEINLPS
jgi:NADP-dependent 3-hydroxy acid dehydrogenase YdfG